MGQATLANFVVVFFVFVIALAMMPAMNTIIEDSANNLNLNPTDTTSLIIAIMRLVPSVLLLMIIIYAIYLSMPRREGSFQ